MARINRKTEDVLEIYKKVGICPGGASVGSVDPWAHLSPELSVIKYISKL